MKVPPLWTVAVRASAQAPSPRLPRKYDRRNSPRAARDASVPSQTEATTTPNSVASAPQPADGAPTGSDIVRAPAVPAEVVVTHEPPREPSRDQHAAPPRGHDPPEHPGREPEHEPDRFALAPVTEQGTVAHRVGRGGDDHQRGRHGLAPGVAHQRVLIAGLVHRA